MFHRESSWLLILALFLRLLEICELRLRFHLIIKIMSMESLSWGFATSYCEISKCLGNEYPIQHEKTNINAVFEAGEHIFGKNFLRWHVTTWGYCGRQLLGVLCSAEFTLIRNRLKVTWHSILVEILP